MNNLDGVFGKKSTVPEFLLSTIPLVGQAFGLGNVIYNSVKLHAINKKIKDASTIVKEKLDEVVDLAAVSGSDHQKLQRTWKILRGVAEFFWLPGMALYSLAALVSSCLNRGKVIESPLDFDLQTEEQQKASWEAVGADFEASFKVKFLEEGMALDKWDDLFTSVSTPVREDLSTSLERLDRLKQGLSDSLVDLVDDLVFSMRSIQNKNSRGYLKGQGLQHFATDSEQAKRLNSLADYQDRLVDYQDSLVDNQP